MLIKDLSAADLTRLLRGPGLHLDTGAFTTHLRSNVGALCHPLSEAYADCQVATGPAIDDFRVAIKRGPGWRGLLGRSGQAYIDGEPTFPPFPIVFAFPMLESTLNWCIAKQVYRYVTFHAGAVERDGRGVILAGPSGSGKSTLCAGLAHRGWRLLSDELVLLRTDTAELAANPRPVSLKNEAIGRMTGLTPQARFSDAYQSTAKGTIRFLYPPREAMARAKAGATPEIVVFPMFRAGAANDLRPISKAQGFMRLVENSVNYFSTLKAGFDALAGLVDRSDFYEFSYGDLDQAIAAIDELHKARMAGEWAA